MPKGKQQSEQNREGAPQGGARPRSKDDHFGRALKSVYDDTLRENIPDEFQDLLGKLK